MKFDGKMKQYKEVTYVFNLKFIGYQIPGDVNQVSAHPTHPVS